MRILPARTARTAALVVLALLTPGTMDRAAAAPGIIPSPVEFAAPDGLMLQGTYWAAAGPGPGVLLLHQCNADRASWEPLGRALAAAGCHVLAFDLRGFGGSKGGLGGDFATDSKTLWPMYPGDVDRAVEFLRGLPDVDGARLGVMGASCGGSQALLLALRDEKVKALGFLSSSLPWLGESDVAQFTANRSMPVLAIGAEEDEGTFERMKAMFDISKDPLSKLILYKGDLHGAPLFAFDAGLVPSIVAWFGSALR